jgi:hypothetical protein
MKTYGGGGIAPSISTSALAGGKRGGTALLHPLQKRLHGFHSRSGCGDKKKNPCPFRESNPSHPVHSQSRMAEIHPEERNRETILLEVTCEEGYTWKIGKCVVRIDLSQDKVQQRALVASIITEHSLNTK